MNAIVSIVFMTCVQAHGLPLKGSCEMTALLWSGPVLRCADLGVIDLADWLHRHPDRVLMGDPHCETRLVDPNTM